MKPGLAVLPMDVWADVFVYPWISRQQLARIVHRFKERAFAEKLQKFLYDPKCGKHTLGEFCTYKPTEKLIKNLSSNQSRKRKMPPYQTSLGVGHCRFSKPQYYKDCAFPEVEMPENITSFKGLTIWHLDNIVLNFLNKIRPLFTDVFLNFVSKRNPSKNVRILLGILQLMLASIRGIRCRNECIEFLKRHFPTILAMAKELELYDDAKPAFIPAYLDWLNKPQDFAVNGNGPRFLKALTKSENILPIVDAFRQQFLTATTSSTFVIFLQFDRGERHILVDEFTIDNAATNEQLTVRNAIYERPKGPNIHYVEILRNSTGEDANIRKWIEERAYYEKKYGYDDDIVVEPNNEGKHIWIENPSIGRITKAEKHQEEDESDGGEDEDEAGPSTSAKMMKK